MVSSSRRSGESAGGKAESSPDGSVGSGIIATAIEIASAEEIRPGGLEIWRPNNFQEWIELKRVDAVLHAWSEQAKHERGLRISSAKWIFLLIAAQVFAIFGVMGFIGFGLMTIDVPVLQVLIGAVCADVFGLGFAVTRFLYREPLKIDLEHLLQHSSKQRPVGPPGPTPR